MRGKLINTFLAEVARLDPAGTAGDPDGAGPLVSGYDQDFQETEIVPAPGGRGTDARKELPAVRIPCQVEVGAYEAMQQLGGGNSPSSRVVLVFHFRDLERMGLVDAETGAPLLRVNDRLVAIYDLAGRLVQEARTPPGLYVTEVQPQAFGIGLARNLLLVAVESRERGTRALA